MNTNATSSMRRCTRWSSRDAGGLGCLRRAHGEHHGTIGAVIADGVASGEFAVEDVTVAAMCTCAAMIRFFHPQMIAHCADKPEPYPRPDDRFCAGGPDAAR